MSCGFWHPDPCMVVSIGDLDIVSDGSGPVGFSEIDGWDTGTDATGGVIPEVLADGGTRGDVFYGPRTITIEGDVDADTHDEYQEIREQFGLIGVDPRWSTLTVDETYHLGLVRQIEVSRMSRVRQTRTGHKSGIFTLSLVASDFPRLGVDQMTATITTAGTVLRNIGTIPADLLVTMNGPLPNPGLVWPGGGWTYGASIPAGETRTADMRKRIVRNPATAGRSRKYAAGDWLSLPPGDTTVTRTGTGTGSITASWRPAWH